MTRPLIMVIEADPAIGLLLDELLTDEGYTVHVCPTAEEAVEWIEQEQPDGIIVDLWLRQRGDGWTILDRLRNDPATSHIPIIVCSGDTHTLQANEARLRSLRCEVVKKPFNLQDLLAKVQHSLAPQGSGKDVSMFDGAGPAMAQLVSVAGCATWLDVLR